MALKSSVERAEQKVGGFATARKKIVIQYQGMDKEESDILDRIHKALSDRGILDAEICDVEVYSKPEEHSVFYVANGDIQGRIEL